MTSKENKRIQKQVIDSDFERVINTLKEDMDWKFDLELKSRTMKEKMFKMRNCSTVAKQIHPLKWEQLVILESNA